MSADTDGIGRRMREAREARGLSQNAVGVRVGTNGHQIWRYENGSLPGPERLAGIAEALEVSVEWLLRGDSAPTTTVERDDTKGAPAVEAFIEHRAELGMPLPEEAIRSLRSTFYKTAEIDQTLVEHAYSSWVARQRGKAIERPSVGGKVDEARGQKRLEPVKKRRL